MATMCFSLNDALRLGTAVPGSSEHHTLAWITQIRRDVVVRVKKRCDVNKVLGLGNCTRAASHGTSMPDGSRSQNDPSKNMPCVRPL
jgi:hypothetical protein